MKVTLKKDGVVVSKTVGRKILVRAETNDQLADLLNTVAGEIRRGHACTNVLSTDGTLRIMRPLRDGEEEHYSDSRDLP